MSSVSFFGNEVVEFFLRNDTVKVKISTLDHLLKNDVISEFSQIFCNLSEVFKGNKAYLRTVVPVFWESKVMKTL